MSKKLMLKEVRGAFVNVFEAKSMPHDPSSEPRYSFTSLIEPGSANDKAVRAAIDEVGKEKFGAKWDAIKKTIEHNNQKYCYQSGDLKDYDGFAGMMALSANRKKKDGRPTVVNRDKSDIDEDDGIVYSGAIYNVRVDIFAYTKPSPGISAGLAGIQFWKDSDAFGAGRAGRDEFEEGDMGDEEFA